MNALQLIISSSSLGRLSAAPGALAYTRLPFFAVIPAYPPASTPRLVTSTNNDLSAQYSLPLYEKLSGALLAMKPAMPHIYLPHLHKHTKLIVRRNLLEYASITHPIDSPRTHDFPVYCFTEPIKIDGYPAHMCYPTL